MLYAQSLKKLLAELSIGVSIQVSELAELAPSELASNFKSRLGRDKGAIDESLMTVDEATRHAAESEAKEFTQASAPQGSLTLPIADAAAARLAEVAAKGDTPAVVVLKVGRQRDPRAGRRANGSW